MSWNLSTYSSMDWTFSTLLDIILNELNLLNLVQRISKWLNYINVLHKSFHLKGMRNKIAESFCWWNIAWGWHRACYPQNFSSMLSSSERACVIPWLFTIQGSIAWVDDTRKYRGSYAISRFYFILDRVHKEHGLRNKLQYASKYFPISNL